MEYDYKSSTLFPFSPSTLFLLYLSITHAFLVCVPYSFLILSVTFSPVLNICPSLPSGSFHIASSLFLPFSSLYMSLSSISPLVNYLSSFPLFSIQHSRDFLLSLLSLYLFTLSSIPLYICNSFSSSQKFHPSTPIILDGVIS